ncbi:MAG: hypothetical protein Q8909_09540 [Bacteroidota bacterium]|nr:hypothetical protein [Bacteroidota bacterium]
MNAALTPSIRFAKFITRDNDASVIIANVRFITNKKHPKFGMCHIFTDDPDHTLSSHPLYDALYMTEESARKVLSDNDFVEVCPDFNAHDIDHLKLVRDYLPDVWIECFNSWSKQLRTTT